MMSSQPTTQPRMYETILNPYPRSHIMAPGSQQPVSFIHLGNQAQSGQPPFFGSPGIITNSQQGPVNTQVVNPATGTETTNFREDAKILGAIQIMIGLMHIGFGIILGFMNVVYGQVLGFASFALISGYPFWGGISFITTGTLSILASKKLSPSLIKSSLGMNIVSACFAFIGVILLLVDVSINGLPNQDYWAVLSGKGIAAMLIIFSLLEFCTNCTTAHFAKQAITKNNRPVLVIPNMYAASPLAPGFS
ncbi:membrane-spanning 4-domains subfamily A member 12-like [Ursus americanus]|uniref:membrane-spanning 4-domains subfamily A member 12-like n=1 Tax=Ursus americanus TaxID=9643 RepID=UPI001E67DBED|nr:membrane-spanning 4-domains subfamily A member 12-like [Ursus americanus]XP_048073609.1 membrane-spanning 4-domains subfamily A member 12 [Ursus arctos]